MDFDNDKEVLETFFYEATSKLAKIEAGLERLRENPDKELIHSIFRHVHSLKANANLLKMKKIEEISNKMEDTLQKYRSGELVPETKSITNLQQITEKLKKLTNRWQESL